MSVWNCRFRTYVSHYSLCHNCCVITFVSVIVCVLCVIPYTCCASSDEENELHHQESEIELQRQRKRDEYHSWQGEKVNFDEEIVYPRLLKLQEENHAKVIQKRKLELKLIKQDLTKMVLRFANLLVKQKLLMNNDCRDHSQSHTLLTAVFIQEPRNHARVEDMIVDDTPGALEAINSNMDALRFDADDDFIYTALAIDRNGGQLCTSCNQHKWGFFPTVPLVIASSVDI